MPREACVVAVVFLAAALAGCGSGGAGGSVTPAPPPGQHVETAPTPTALGPIVVETAASAGYKSAAFGSAQHMAVAIVGIYGSRITRLEYRPAPGRLCGATATDKFLKVSDEDGSGSSILLDYAITCARWRPAGDMIVFTDDVSIYTCRPDGQQMQRVMVTGLGPEVRGVDWSPTDYIYFGGNNGGNLDIGYVLWPATWPNATWVTSDASADVHPDVSPDNTKIVWARHDGTDFDIVVMPRNGNPNTDIEAVTGNLVDEFYPRWSPDGRYIAYQRYRAAGDTRIHVYDTVTEQDIELTAGYPDRVPTWSSDGRYILFSRSDDLYRVPFDGSAPAQLVLAGWGDYPDCWVPVASHWRVLVGPAGTDWGGNDPPFGTRRLGAIVSYAADHLATAVTFSVASGEVIAMRDRTPPGADGLVVAEVRAGHIYRVLRDNGAGISKTIWVLSQPEGAPGAALLSFSAGTGLLTAVIPVWDQATTVGVGGGLKVEADAGGVVISGVPMRAYDADGNPLTGARPVYRVRLDGRTGEPLP